MLNFLFPSSKDLALSLVIGLILDVVYPEHRGVLLRIHPVHTSYFCSLRLARGHNSRLHGLYVWLTCVTLHLLPLVVILKIVYSLPGLFREAFWVAVAAIAVKLSITPTLLIKKGLRIYKLGSAGDLEGAREEAQGLVRRSLEGLEAKYIYSATIESLAESFVDGILSPLFYYIIFGPLGALFQRIVNTLDGSLGFKTKDFIHEGFISAKADDIINYIPARLSVVIIALCSLKRFKSVIRTWKSYRYATESPNAGNPMSAISGSLNIRLKKRGHYIINDEGRDPAPRDVIAAVKIILCSTVLSILLSVTFILVFNLISLRLI